VISGRTGCRTRRNEYCAPGVEGAHEKGGVEGEVGRFRRNFLVPVPRVATLAELNARLAGDDLRDDGRHIGFRPSTAAADFSAEAPLLRPVPAGGFDTGTVLWPRADKFARVSVGKCRYSVPARLIGKAVRVRLTASELHAAELGRLRRDAGQKIAAAAGTAREQVTTAQETAGRARQERDDALAAARGTRTAADAEISRARQAETDARAETQRARADAARERDALRDSYTAQHDAQRALTDAERAEAQLETERADRRQLTSHITSSNGHEIPAPSPGGASDRRSR
jgi:hypothetical protein